MYMGATWGPDRLLYRAIVLSLALHLVVALFFPALATFQGDGPSVETISFVRVMHISVLPTRPVASRHAAVALERSPVPSVTIPPRKVGHATHVQATAPARVSRAPIIGTEQRQGGAAPQTESSAPPAAVAATPAAATVASSQTRDFSGGIMPFGAEEPSPVLDPAVHNALLALGVHTTVTIDVDADGKTKTVTFVPEIDASLESKIRAMLASAHWDPAFCGGGVACESHATIKL